MKFNYNFKHLAPDLIAGLVVFLVALPLCLGVAHASKAPVLSGIIAGIIGGIVVGIISGSQTSVSGPAAGLIAIVIAQIAAVGSFNGFLVAVVFAGVIQLGMAILKMGGFARFFPNCVIKGLLAAIGIVIILKQIPHLLSKDMDDEGEMSFFQPDQKNTFTELFETIHAVFTLDIEFGVVTIGLISIAVLLLWDNIKFLKKLPIPGALVVVVLGALLAPLFSGKWAVDKTHLVNLQVANFQSLFTFPDFGSLSTSLKAILIASVTIAIVASLETLLNVEGVDKLDPEKRASPPNRELFAQGIGNICSGLLGGLPITSVIIRSSVNINAGGKTKVSTIFHGILLLSCVLIICIPNMPNFLNRIPLSSLAAILILTGFKLANPKLFINMWKQGLNQFFPFIVTILAIVFTDLLIGILIGLLVSGLMILINNFKRPVYRVVERHVGGEVLHFQFPSQVTFLNRASIDNTFDEIPNNSHVLIDARDTDYIDADVLELIHEYEREKAPARNIKVSLLGLKSHYKDDEDRILFADYTSRELRDKLTPDEALKILQEGNERFLKGSRLSRDLNRQLNSTASGQFPLAAVLSCIDSRAPVELIFDVGLGDLLTVRIAGNVAKEKVYGSLEYATACAGVKLVVVMGHTRCGAVTAAIQSIQGTIPKIALECQNLDVLLKEIRKSVNAEECKNNLHGSKEATEQYIDKVAADNVKLTIQSILENSNAIRNLVDNKTIRIVGCMYDVKTGYVKFFE